MNIAVWGAGHVGKYLSERYSSGIISFYIDKDEKKRGQYLNKIEIISVCDLFTNAYSNIDKVIMGILDSHQQIEILYLLKQVGCKYVGWFSPEKYKNDDILYDYDITWLTIEEGLTQIEALIPFANIGPYATNDNYLFEKGWFNTLNGEVVDNNGDSIPWVAYPCLDFLMDRINNDMRVFEYGSGGSTLWWSKRVRHVISIEHNKEWFDNFQTKLQKCDNVEAYYIQLIYGGDYSNKIFEYSNEFDVIMIDGRDRVNCAKNCIRALKDNGVILFDNSDRVEYQEAYDYIRNKGFKELAFCGPAAIIYTSLKTSIFYREKNCLNI